MDPNQSKDPNYQPAFNNPDYWNNTSPQTPSTQAPQPEPVTPVENIPAPQTEVSSTETQMPMPNVTNDPVLPPQPEPEVQTASILSPNTGPENISPNYSSSPENIPSSPKPIGSSNGLMIVMVVLVIVLLGATGLFAFQNYQLRQQISGTPSSPVPAALQPATETSATPDPTANWKTYSNTKLSFSFKYPGDTYPYLKESATGVYLATSQSQNGTSLAPTDTWLTVSAVNTAFTNVDQFTSSDAKKATYADSQKTSSIIAGVNGEKLTYNLLVGSSTQYNLEGLVIYNGKLYQITFSSWSMDTLTQNSSTFDQILASFSFAASQSVSPAPQASPSASPISSVCSSGYKLFDNNAIQFCYPESLKETSASKPAAVVLDDTNQTLKITQNFQGGWGGSPCLTIDKTTVSGYASKRLSWKKENSDGTCQNVYTSFAEMVNEGNFTFPFPYAIELTSKSASFQDSTNFLSIEKSFKVTSTGSTGQ